MTTMELMVRTQREKGEISVLIKAGKARIIEKMPPFSKLTDVGKGNMRMMKYNPWRVEVFDRKKSNA